MAIALRDLDINYDLPCPTDVGTPGESGQKHVRTHDLPLDIIQDAVQIMGHPGDARFDLPEPILRAFLQTRPPEYPIEQWPFLQFRLHFPSPIVGIDLQNSLMMHAVSAIRWETSTDPFAILGIHVEAVDGRGPAAWWPVATFRTLWALPHNEEWWNGAKAHYNRLWEGATLPDGIEPSDLFHDEMRRFSLLAIGLVNNTCAYLETLGTKVHEDVARQRKKIDRRDRKKRKRISTASPIIVLNDKTARVMGRGPSALGTGNKLETRHIVRGHWRNQTHGKNRAERKRIWIKPFWRGPREATPTERVYRVEKENT